MTVAEAITAIRASTLHDSDTQVTDAQLTVKIDQEFRRLRRALTQFVPSLFETFSSPTITSGNNTIAKPADFERLRRLERLINGTLFYPVPLVDPLNAMQAIGPVFYEQGANFVIQPASAAPGSYRLTYTTTPASGYSSFDVPAGCEDIIVERVAGWVRVRLEEDPSPHWTAALEIWKEQKSMLIRRYGFHSVPGLVLTR